MKCDKKDLLLYAVTDRHWLEGRKLIDVVKESLDGGVTMVQLRGKETLASDVVFVIDKSTSPEKESALRMLEALQGQIGADAQVRVGVVTFNTTAVKNGFFDLTTELDKIREAFAAPQVTGTNLHAGILAGKDMLDADETVDNSRKYGANALSLGSACEEDTVTLWMEDNGPGVPEEQLPCLFEPFYRGDAARTKPGAGSGLGLAVVKRSMQQMGGSVRAENAPGGGLRIVMQLPMAKEG